METVKTSLEEYFAPFRENIVGRGEKCTTAYGTYPVVYADWIAEGRLYGPIEDTIKEKMGGFVANPHSYTNFTGQNITQAYKHAREIIKKHVNASEEDVLVTVGHGMTGALERMIQILKNTFDFEKEKPVVFITHMEHHSNHTTWQQVGAELVVVEPDAQGLPDVMNLETRLREYSERSLKIGSFTGCSNVTGMVTPYHKLAEVMHAAGGICMVDFAASAPYVSMDMHPENEAQRLDAIFFAPHKFLGGPGSCGVLVFNKSLHCGTPSVSGGGNVKWTQPEGQFGVSSDIEIQEDGGTPAYLQTIRTALAIKLKDKMGIENIQKREEELLEYAISRMQQNNRMKLLECEEKGIHKIGAISFNIEGLHYNLVVRLLNDRFGIQTRGGWSCASTYGHYLFHLSQRDSDELVERLESGNFSGKPGWVRISLHPTMTNDELDYCLEAVEKICEYGDEWGAEYSYETSDNEYYPNQPDRHPGVNGIEELFEL